MIMDEKTIKEALLKGERVTLECKKAKAEVPKSVWQTYSAFANTIGGLILLGVDEDLQEKDVSKRFQIIGVDEPSKIITDFWNTLNSDKVNENILVDSDVEVVNVDGAQIICIHVPQTDWQRGLDIGRTDDVWQRTRHKGQICQLPHGLSGYESSGG